MIRDSYSVLDWVLTNTSLKMKDLCLYGRSMGTGVSSNLAYQMRHDPFYQVTLVSGYYSIKEIFRTQAGCFGASIVKNYYPSGDRIAHFGCPVLIIHGDRDKVVPVSHAHRLKTRCDENKTICKVDTRPGQGHVGYCVMNDIVKPLQTFNKEQGLDSSRE